MAAKKIIAGADASVKAPKAPSPKKEAAPKKDRAATPKKEAAPKTPKPKNEGVEVTTTNLPDVMPVDGEQAAQITADTTKANTRKPKAVVSEADKHASVQRRKEAAEAKKAAKAAGKEAAKAAKLAEREAKKSDPNYAINLRRTKAKFAFLQACVHCGSGDVNANRSPYKSEFEGNEITVREFHCHECHKYTKANAADGVALPADATVKNLGYVVTRNNFHRPKGNPPTRALELVGLAGNPLKEIMNDKELMNLHNYPVLADQLKNVLALLAVASGNTAANEEQVKKANATLKDNLVLTF
jgi:hypothetical protein